MDAEFLPSFFLPLQLSLSGSLFSVPEGWVLNVEESEDSVYSIYRQPDCIKSLFNEEVSLSLKRKRGSRGGKKKAKGSKQPKLI
jgi:hypothetical protein